MYKNIARAFIISSSLPAFFVTALYLGYGASRAGIRNLANTQIQWFMATVPFMYGIFGAINYIAVARGYLTPVFLIPVIVGATLGLVLSVVGRYIGLPQKLFGFSESTEYMVHIYAPILYAGIFTAIVNPLIAVFI